MIELSAISACGSIAEVLRPGVDLFLPGRVPRHLAAERIRLRRPAIGARLHARFEIRRLLRPAFALQVLEHEHERCRRPSARRSRSRPCSPDRSGTSSCCRLVEIPVPRLVRDEAARDCAPPDTSTSTRRRRADSCRRDSTVSAPGASQLVHVVQFSARVVREVGQLLRRRRRTGSCARRTCAARRCTGGRPRGRSSMNCSILVDLAGLRLAVQLHHRREPRAGAAFVAEAGDPHARVLLDDAVLRAVVAHHRRAALERIVRVLVPLLREQEAAEIRDRLRGRLDHVVAHRLLRAVVVRRGDARAAPLLAAQRVLLPAVARSRARGDRHRAGGLDRRRR